MTARASQGPARGGKVDSFAVIDQEVDERTRVIAVEGELDVYTAPSVKARLEDAIDAGVTQLVIDFSLLEFIDSTAIAMLVGARRCLPPDGRIALVCTHHYVLLILEVAGLEDCFEIFETREAAEEYVRGDGG